MGIWKGTRNGLEKAKGAAEVANGLKITAKSAKVTKGMGEEERT
jgi:hypothetical protein